MHTSRGIFEFNSTGTHLLINDKNLKQKILDNIILNTDARNVYNFSFKSKFTLTPLLQPQQTFNNIFKYKIKQNNDTIVYSLENCQCKQNIGFTFIYTKNFDYTSFSISGQHCFPLKMHTYFFFVVEKISQIVNNNNKYNK